MSITDRAVSKWETGKSIPDSSIMLELCRILDISVNELLSGEKIEMENANQKADEALHIECDHVRMDRFFPCHIVREKRNSGRDRFT